MVQSSPHDPSASASTSPPPSTTAPRAEARRPHGSRLPAVVAALAAGLGGATVVGSLPLGYWTALGPGPGFFPLWLGLLLVALGGIWLLLEVRSRREDAPERPADEDAPPEYSLPTAAAIVMSLVALATLLEVLGYQLSMLLFLLFHLLVLGRRGLLLSVVIAVAGSFGVFVVFTQLLGVPLPASTLPLLRGMGL